MPPHRGDFPAADVAGFQMLQTSCADPFPPEPAATGHAGVFLSPPPVPPHTWSALTFENKDKFVDYMIRCMRCHQCGDSTVCFVADNLLPQQVADAPFATELRCGPCSGYYSNEKSGIRVPKGKRLVLSKMGILHRCAHCLFMFIGRREARGPNAPRTSAVCPTCTNLKKAELVDSFDDLRMLWDITHRERRSEEVVKMHKRWLQSMRCIVCSEPTVLACVAQPQTCHRWCNTCFVCQNPRGDSGSKTKPKACPGCRTVTVPQETEERRVLEALGMLTRCRMCNQAMVHMQGVQPVHEDCPLRPIRCPYRCGAEMPSMDVSHHQKRCHRRPCEFHCDQLGEHVCRNVALVRDLERLALEYPLSLGAQRAVFQAWASFPIPEDDLQERELRFVVHEQLMETNAAAPGGLHNSEAEETEGEPSDASDGSMSPEIV